MDENTQQDNVKRTVLDYNDVAAMVPFSKEKRNW